jgi:hypothetical protein
MARVSDLLKRALSIDALKLAFLVGGIAVFAALYSWFFESIWAAHGSPPHLNSQAVYLASLLAGALGTAFAVAVGIQRKDPATNEKKLALGSTLLASGWGQVLANAGVWVYALVGVTSLVTVFWNQAESPASIKAFAAAFIGYAVSVFTSALTGPGATQ